MGEGGIFLRLVLLKDSTSSLYFQFLMLFGIEVFGYGGVVFSFSLPGSNVVGGVGREGWRGGFVGVESLRVTPSPSFPPSLF